MGLMSQLDFSPSCQIHKIPISWHKTSKTQHFIISWCFWSWKPIFLHFIRPEYLKKTKKIREHLWTIWGNSFCGNMKLKKNEISKTLSVHFLNC